MDRKPISNRFLTGLRRGHDIMMLAGNDCCVKRVRPDCLAEARGSGYKNPKREEYKRNRKETSLQ